jgi:crotonobetainyl-CoA:carnitine CoA-transferase CaiB-like acyl-CoA transferase
MTKRTIKLSRGEAFAAEILKGIRILSFAHYLQGPAGVQMLADLGADVIKVEPPWGYWERHWSGANVRKHGESVMFLALNRNKRSLCLDLKKPAGAQVIRDLLPRIDVLIENFRPAVMERLGFGYKAVSAVNPRIIYASCSGYGAEGPYRERPGQDLLIQAMSGLVANTGTDDSPPTAGAAAIVDQHGAALLAQGVLAALFARERSGEGCKVEISLLNAGLDLQMEALAYYINGALKPPRSNAGMATWYHHAPYGIYATADGYIGLNTNPADKLAQALECPELQTYAGRDPFEERDAISTLVRDALRKQPTGHWIDVFTREGIWHAPVNDYEALEHDPQILHNKVFVDTFNNEGHPIRLIANAIRFDGATPPVRLPPPALGQHSVEILKEAGYAEKQIRILIESGVVKQTQIGTAEP